MNNEFLYEKAINTLLESLKDNINNFTASFETINDYYKSQPLFMITSPKYELIRCVSISNNKKTRSVIAELCKELCSQRKTTIESKSIKNIDFYEVQNNVKIGYYVSLQEEYTLDFEEASKIGIDNIVIIVLKSNLTNLKPNNNKYSNYKYKNKIKNITLEDFLNSVNEGEYELFKNYVGKFNYEAERMLGLTISPIPTKNALDKKRKKIKAEFASHFFTENLNKHFTCEEILELDKNFSESNLLSISRGTYIDSFVSSEWYYDLLIDTDAEMDKTAIIAGYLKSVEQLLFSMILSKSDVFKFKLRPKITNSHTEKFVTLTKENSHELLTMAGSLLTSIDINFKNHLSDIYINSQIGEKVQCFLHKFFEHTRNGYLHKDNIYTLDEIKQIRAETYGAYFLLVSSFKFDASKL